MRRHRLRTSHPHIPATRSHSAASTTFFDAKAAFSIPATARAGTINRDLIFTAGNRPAAISRYKDIGDTRIIAAASATLRNRG